LSDLFTPVERNAAFDPHKPALRFEREAIDYAAFAARVRAIAAGLRRAGVGEGERVAVLSPNHPDVLALLYAASRIGALLLPLNWRLAHDELRYIVEHAAPKLFVAARPHEDDAARLAPPAACRRLGAGGDFAEADGDDLGPPGDPDRPCLLVYTSGTTGRPKGALVSSAALIANAVQSHHMHQMTAADHVLTTLALFHVGGLNIQTTPALMAGATVTLHARFDPSATLAAIERDRPSLTVLVPTMMDALTALPAFADADLSALRAVATGSTIVPERTIARFTERGVPVLCVYGATETLPIAAYDRAGLARVVGGTGRAGLLSRLAILDETGEPAPQGAHGEIAVAGPLFSGYFGDEAATAEAMHDGFFRTGDIGSLGPDGTLTVHGENVYPAEVERVLSAHPAVAECAVVGKSDPRWQEVPVAFVVPRAAVTADALVDHTAGLLARYKVPRDIRFVDALPRTAIGKVRHEVLKQRAEEGPLARTGAKA